MSVSSKIEIPTSPNPLSTSWMVKSVPLLLTYKNPYLAAASSMAFPTAGSLGLEMSMTGSSIEAVVSAILREVYKGVSQVWMLEIPKVYI